MLGKNKAGETSRCKFRHDDKQGREICGETFDTDEPVSVLLHSERAVRQEELGKHKRVLFAVQTTPFHSLRHSRNSREEREIPQLYHHSQLVEQHGTTLAGTVAGIPLHVRIRHHQLLWLGKPADHRMGPQPQRHSRRDQCQQGFGRKHHHLSEGHATGQKHRDASGQRRV